VVPAHRASTGTRMRVVRLSAVMSGLFVLLSIPVLIFILAYNYRQNAAAINATLNDVVTKTKQVSIEDAENLINPVAATLRLLAAAAAESPERFRNEASRDMLYQALTSAPQIDAAFVSFEDGFHRVATRMDDDRRRSDPKIPVCRPTGIPATSTPSQGNPDGSGIAHSTIPGRMSWGLMTWGRSRTSELLRATKRRRRLDL